MTAAATDDTRTDTALQPRSEGSVGRDLTDGENVTLWVGPRARLGRVIAEINGSGG